MMARQALGQRAKVGVLACLYDSLSKTTLDLKWRLKRKAAKALCTKGILKSRAH